MCLGEMSVAGDWTDLTTYTTKWLDLVNRGGLFPLNDKSFRFFGAVEAVVRKLLPNLCTQEVAAKQKLLQPMIISCSIGLSFAKILMTRKHPWSFSVKLSDFLWLHIG